MTISSAPQDGLLTFHIRLQGTGSWTRNVAKFLQLMAPPNMAHVEYSRVGIDGKTTPGKHTGPNNLPVFRLYGPISAPTQHISEYGEVLVIASGIGVTPLAGVMKSIVHHRWRFAVGHAFPSRVTFVWATKLEVLPAFRWLIRQIREADDQVSKMEEVSGGVLPDNRIFAFHIFVTSYDNIAPTPIPADGDSTWGRRRHATEEGCRRGSLASRQNINFDEKTLYNALLKPTKEPVDIGHVTVTAGRPNWEQCFGKIHERAIHRDIGVTFCGNKHIAGALAKCCDEFNRTNACSREFHLHKEVF